MAKAEVRIVGIQALIEGLQDIPDLVRDSVWAKANQVLASQITRDLRRASPRHIPESELNKEHGTSKSGVRRRAIRKNNPLFDIGITQRVSPGSAFWSGFVNAGTGERFHKSGKSVGAIKGTGYWDKVFDRYDGDFGEQIWVNSAVAELARVDNIINNDINTLKPRDRRLVQRIRDL